MSHNPPNKLLTWFSFLLFHYSAWAKSLDDSAVKVVTRADLARLLLESLEETYKHSPLPNTQDLADILSCFKTMEQLDQAIEKAFDDIGVRLIERDTGNLVCSRIAEMLAMPEWKPLPISVAMRIDRVDIPDPAKDEIILHVLLTTGCPLSAFAEFAKKHGLMAHLDIDAAIARWRASSFAVGIEPDERKLLDEILGIEFDSTTMRQEFTSEVSVGLITDYIWRESSLSINISTTFHLDKFPFDVSPVYLTLRPRVSDFEGTTLIIDAAMGRSYDLPVRGLKIIPPRGFDIPGRFLHPQEYIHSPGIDFLPEPIIQYAFTLRRRPQTLLWRVVLPSAVIVGLAFIAVSVAMLGIGNLEGVLTSVLPSVLIALVALQLTANQYAPAQSGRTLLDVMFVANYCTLLALFLSIQFVATPFGRSLWIVCGALLAYVWVLFFDAWTTWYTAKEKVYYAQNSVIVTNRRVIVSSGQWSLAGVRTVNIKREDGKCRLYLLDEADKPKYYVDTDTLSEGQLLADALNRAIKVQ